MKQSNITFWLLLLFLLKLSSAELRGFYGATWNTTTDPEHWQIPEVNETSLRKAMERSETFLDSHRLMMSIPVFIFTKQLDYLLSNFHYTASRIRSFPCHKGDMKIIPYSFVCDHKVDCKGGRDENKKFCINKECKLSTELWCSSSGCISSEAVCDMYRDCEDGSDEEYCQNTCIGHLCCTGKCIPKHMVGDGHIDCTGCDETDEKNDESLSAVSTLNPLERCVFLCNKTQCVYPSQLNDGVVDCQGPEGPLDETIGVLEHVNKCRTFNKLRPKVAEWAPLCVYVRDRYGTVLGCRDKSHLEDCANFTCPEGYIKCPGSYCIPVHYLGDGIPDCPGVEDEHYKLAPEKWKGYFYCTLSNIILHPNLVCDGHVDCSLMEEDELNCHVSCAAGFICLAGTVTVGDYDKTIPLRNLDFIDDRTRYLDLSGVDISSVSTSGTKTQQHNLVYISFANCNIISVDYDFADAIGRVKSIRWMNLSYNVINEIPTQSIFKLTSNLLSLDLSHNKQLSVIQASAFDSSIDLRYLNLSHTGLVSLHYAALQGLYILKLLHLSYTMIDSLLGKNFPDSLTVYTLDLRGTMINYFEHDTFDGLIINAHLYTDVSSLCCPDVRGSTIPEYNCHAPRDAVSSCTDLIRNRVQKILLWVMGIIALLGNTTVIVYRLVWDAENLKKPYFMFVTNLGISDLLMGVYLVIIAAADVVYRDAYVWNDKEWRYGVTCKIAGFLSTLSSETSMFFIFLVTLDRLLVIKFPFGNYRISKAGKILLATTAWMIGLVLAVIPLLPIFGENNIYTSNALCLGLPLTSARPDGWGFSMGVFIVFNFTMFLIIAVGQFMIYRAMSSHRSSIVQNSARRAQDIEVAKTLLLVVLSDFLCWFPIGVIGLLALAGKEIGREAYAWSAVLVLPVNSALNPILYTIPVVIDKWKKFKHDWATRSH